MLYPSIDMLCLHQRGNFMFQDKNIRSWMASLCFLVLVVGLIFFLTYVKIPQENKDIITGIVGMIVGSISSSIAIFTGRDPEDVKHLRDQIAELEDDKNSLIARLRDAQIDKDILRKGLEGLQDQIITRLSIFVGEERLRAVGHVPDKVEEWLPKETQQYTPRPGRLTKVEEFTEEKRGEDLFHDFLDKNAPKT